MTQTPRPTPAPPPITDTVYLTDHAVDLPTDPTPAARQWALDLADADALGHAALALRHADALAALRTVWRSRGHWIATADRIRRAGQTEIATARARIAELEAGHVTPSSQSHEEADRAE